MSANKAFIEDASHGLLNTVADEPVLGHQSSKVAHDVLVSRHSFRVETILEKNADSPPNIWWYEKVAGTVLIAAQPPRPCPSSKLWIKHGADRELLYGRNSQLQKMPQLGTTDLVRSAPASVTEIREIIYRLRNVTATELS